MHNENISEKVGFTQTVWSDSPEEKCANTEPLQID